MSGIDCSWGVGVGSEPPPPEAPDCYRVFVKYQGGHNNSLTFENCGTSHRMGNPDMPNGTYFFDPRGVKDGVLSKYDEEKCFEYVHTEGSEAVSPVYNDAPDAGDESVAGPTDFRATAAA